MRARERRQRATSDGDLGALSPRRARSGRRRIGAHADLVDARTPVLPGAGTRRAGGGLRRDLQQRADRVGRGTLLQRSIGPACVSSTTASTPATFGSITDSERRAAREALGIGDRRVAVFIGALGDRRKGFDVLFDAWRGLAADPAWDVDLFVVGAGAEREAWMQQAREAGLAERIRFLGFRSDVASVLAAADVLVHPARYEPYGLGVHEAICRGVPAIVTVMCRRRRALPEDARRPHRQ